MLAGIPASLFNTWKLFYELEPDGAERNDWGLAHVVQAVVRNGKPLKEFMLPFGDARAPVLIQQPIAFQEMLIDSWIAGSNAVFNKGKK